LTHPGTTRVLFIFISLLRGSAGVMELLYSEGMATTWLAHGDQTLGILIQLIRGSEDQFRTPTDPLIQGRQACI